MKWLNKAIKQHLPNVVSDHQGDFLTAYCSSAHESAGEAPASIIMSREVRLPCDLKFDFAPSKYIAEKDYTNEQYQEIDYI